MGIRRFIRRGLHAIGLDIYRYPYACERLIPHLSLLLPAHKIETVIDVGANIGQFANKIRALNPLLNIHSFEPNPKVFQTLSANAALDSRWFAHELALGRSDGEIVLNVTASDDFSSCLESSELGRNTFATDLAIEDRIAVKIQTLDNMSKLDGFDSNRVLLKLDTQGYDLEVLRGGESYLKQVQIVVTEVSMLPLYEGTARFEDMLAYLKSYGFELTGLFPVNRDADFRIIEADCVFAKLSSL